MKPGEVVIAMLVFLWGMISTLAYLEFFGLSANPIQDIVIILVFLIGIAFLATVAESRIIKTTKPSEGEGSKS